MPAPPPFQFLRAPDPPGSVTNGHDGPVSGDHGIEAANPVFFAASRTCTELIPGLSIEEQHSSTVMVVLHPPVPQQAFHVILPDTTLLHAGQGVLGDFHELSPSVNVVGHRTLQGWVAQGMSLAARDLFWSG